SQAGSTDSVQLTSGTSGDPLLVAPATSTVAPATTAATTADATASTTASTVAETVATTAAPAGVTDGTYVGASDSNRWGTVQVQVVYSGGQLVDVQILQYPNGDNKSVRINQRALPTLISEAISVQSGDVNTVSGATYTSDSYRISLQSAIDAAKSASGITG
ncbi:MAG: FMN-binding protein, partial [Ilumatobacteraceae bacterium]